MAVAAILDRDEVSDQARAARPGLQGILDGLVSGPGRVIAPGVTAYVSGPRGTWELSAGLVNAETGESMRPDLRMHVDSNSKAWTATLILQLFGEGKMRLEDTVEQWLPGLLPDGDRITVRQLLNHTSGLVDDEADITPDPMRAVRQVRDAAIRSRLVRLLRQVRADPMLPASPRFWVRFAAALPLRSAPGTAFDYSNIGYEVVGMIAAKVAGAPLRTLYRQRIIVPLGLSSAAYRPRTCSRSANWSSPERMAELGHTAKLSDLALDEFDAIVVCGGRAPMFGFRDNEDLKAAIARFYEADKPTAALCHGTSALIDVRISDGSYLIDGKAVTGFANVEEETADAAAGTKVMPWRVEDAMRERGANYVQGGLWKRFAVRDGQLITGQQQYSGRKVARLVIEALGA